mgnify:CR=1 FL=1
MKHLLILTALINLSLGSYINVTEKNWTIPPTTVAADHELSSADNTWILFDANYNPILLRVNQSAATQSSSVSGLQFRTLSIEQDTIFRDDKKLKISKESAPYFMNFPANYTPSSSGSMISFQLFPDANGINQLFYYFNDLQVEDKNTEFGFKAGVLSLFDSVGKLFTGSGTLESVVEEFKDFTGDFVEELIDDSLGHLEKCGRGLLNIKDKLKGIYSNVKSKQTTSAIQSVVGTADSMYSLYEECTNLEFLVPDSIQDEVECGNNLVGLAKSIAAFSVNPASFLKTANNIKELVQGLTSSMSECTGAFSSDTSELEGKGVTISGSGFLTNYAVSTQISVLGWERAPQYLGIVIFTGSSSLEVIGVKLGTATPTTYTLSSNFAGDGNWSCSTGEALKNNTMYCTWVEYADSSYVIMGATVDLTSSSGTTVDAVVLVNNGNVAFQDIEAFVTTKGYGVIYASKGDDQLNAWSNLSTTPRNLGERWNGRSVMSLGSIKDANLYIFWKTKDAATGLNNVTYEIYNGSTFDLVDKKGEIISYDPTEDNFFIMNNGQAFYGCVYDYISSEKSTLQLGIIVSAPKSLVYSFVLIICALMTILLY